MNVFKYVKAIGMIFLWSYTILNAQEKANFSYKHIIVIGFDGLSPDGLANANTPNFDKLIKEGASTMHARTVLPSSSSSNWASMIMGAGPEQHGITSNEWERDNLTLPSVVQKDPFLFPTIFYSIDKYIQNAEIGAVYHWGGFGRLLEKSTVDYDVNGKDEMETVKLATQYISSKNPTFTFVHFDHVDHAGHHDGHGTPEYYKSVEKADQFLGQLISAIEKSFLKDETLVIVSSDHGGIGKGHGGETLNEMEIPFILWGGNVKKNYKIKYPVYQYDNAATVAYGFGFKLPYACIGKPVIEAFEGNEIKDEFPVLEQLKAPKFSSSSIQYKPAGGIFLNSAEVEITNLNEKGEIRYSIDGKNPTSKSNLYSKSFQIYENAVVKAAIFENGLMVSPVTTAYYRIRKVEERPVSYQLFYLDKLKVLHVLDELKPNATGFIFEITSDEIKEPIKENTAVSFTTQIKIVKEEDYYFSTRSDDGSILWVNGQKVVDNDGDHGVQEKSGEIHLLPGLYELKVNWFNGGGDGWLDVYYATSEIPKQILPMSVLLKK